MFMKEKRLANGVKALFYEQQTDSVTVEVAVKVGSNYEPDDLRGISHFLEHLVFAGTKKRKDAREISNEIEKLGGEINASTGNDTTHYYVKVPKKYLKTALDILSDILLNPVFNEKDIENERKVLFDEIKMINDDPRMYQWVLFQRACFKGVIGIPVYGSNETVKSITKKDILDFYSKYYCSNNFHISIVGGCENPFELVEEFFGSAKENDIEYPVIGLEVSGGNELIENKEVLQSYFIIGYPIVARGHKDSYVLEVIKGILGKGQSGRLFDEIRNKRGLAYEVGVHIEQGIDYGFFAAYIGTNKSNLDKVKNLILKEFNRLLDVSVEEVKEAKTFSEGSFLLNMEDTAKRAAFINSLSVIDKEKDIDNYIENIKKVNVGEVKRVVETYFTDAVSIVLQPK